MNKLKKENDLSSKLYIKRKCNCGHTVEFVRNNNFDHKICSWCGKYVYKSEEAEFKNLLMKRMETNE